jgi:hypothetical protein
MDINSTTMKNDGPKGQPEKVETIHQATVDTIVVTSLFFFLFL